MKRSVRILIALLVVLPLAALSVYSLQARALSQRLSAEAQQLDARRFEIPGNGEGNLIECLALASDIGPDLSFTLPMRGDVVRRAMTNAPEFAQDAAAREEARRSDPWLDDTLHCASLRTIAPASGTGVFPDLLNRRRQTLPRAMDSLASLVPVAMRERLLTGRADEALAQCADTLTLTTAWFRLEGLESELATLGPSNTVMPVCREAFLAATPEARQRFTTRIQALIALAPDFSEVMRIERVQLSLRHYGGWIAPDIAATFPEQARLAIDKQHTDRWARGFAPTLALRQYWKQFDRGMRELEIVSALAAPQREREIERVQKQLEAPFLWRFLAAAPVDLKYQLYSPYGDRLRDDLRGLIVEP